MTRVELSVRNFIKGNRRLPNYAVMKDMDTGREVKVSPREYCGMFWSNYNFYYRNGRLPNWVTKNLLKSEPTQLLYQKRSTTCGPASLAMASAKLFKPMTEEFLAGVYGTTGSGTNPANLVDTSRRSKSGLKITRLPRISSSVQGVLNRYGAVVCHYETGAAKCSNFLNNYGHYCLILSVAGGYYTVYDPTKGVFKCPVGQLDAATHGRSIYYYGVELV